MVNIYQEDKRVFLLGWDAVVTGTPRAFGILSGDDKPVGHTVTKAARSHFSSEGLLCTHFFTIL